MQGASLNRSGNMDNQMALRNVVLPSPVPGEPNWGIPSAVAENCDPELQSKLERFQELKQQGKHFNESLMSNKAFRNPHIYAKLVEFVDINESTTNYPRLVWDPEGMPKDWLSESIAEAQKRKYEELQASQAAGQRKRIDFVSSSSSKSRVNAKNDEPVEGKSREKRLYEGRYKPYADEADERTHHGRSRSDRDKRREHKHHSYR
ncbi:HCNGP-domain-containing protein [Serendipita vermifera]|nr:HCNGP-domain-containing protein [Serendipita vermifera]